MSEVKNIFLSFLRVIASALSYTKRYLKKFCRNFWRSFTSWIDPKLEKYRTRRPRKRASRSQEPVSNDTPAPTVTRNVNHEAKVEARTSAAAATSAEQNSATASKPYTPTSIEDFLALLKRTPRSVISQRERHVIATIMNFPTTLVSELMLPPSAITYVKEDEILGPLTLDRLYRSGFQHFPVIDKDRRLIGLIHTTALNSLEIKQTSRAREILDPKVYYLREDYTLNQALAAFLRTNCYFFLVIDRFERIVGMLTYEMIVDYLLGETPTDNFDRDSDRLAVAKRRLS